jgi:hypothetical protein
MATIRQAQTGNRVYRGVGTSPNMGPVSGRGAQGYIAREVRNRNQGARPVGNDGKSDSRSGVAKRALMGMQGSLGNNIGRPQAGNLKGPPKNGPKQRNPLANKQQPNTNAVGQTQPTAPQVPQIKVNSQGMLELPYSQNLSMEALSALQTSNDDLASLQQEEQQLQQAIAEGRREADTVYGQLKEETLSGNASGGTAFSSMYAKGVADNATAYSNTLADLSRQEADGQQQFSSRRASIQNALAQQLAAAAQGEADILNEDAGNLGYGTYQGETHSHDKHRNKNKNKNKPRQGAAPAKGKNKGKK